MNEDRIYALYADDQEGLQRLIGMRGILSGADGLGLKSFKPPLQAQGDFKLYGRLREDAFGKPRSGKTIQEAIDFVASGPNRVLGVSSLEQISDRLSDVTAALQRIHESGSGVAIRFSSRTLEHCFSKPGEHHGWIWIGPALESFLGQLKIAGSVSEMFHPSPWVDCSDPRAHEALELFARGATTDYIVSKLGVPPRAVHSMRKSYRKFVELLRKQESTDEDWDF